MYYNVRFGNLAVKSKSDKRATKKDFLGIGIFSLLLSLTGFILDLNERVPDIKTNVFEVVMMTGLCYGIISVFYFPINLLIQKIAKYKFRIP